MIILDHTPFTFKLRIDIKVVILKKLILIVVNYNEVMKISETEFERRLTLILILESLLAIRVVEHERRSKIEALFNEGLETKEE